MHDKGGFVTTTTQAIKWGFTYNPHDIQSKAVAEHIRSNNLSISMREVEAFGRPELRIARGTWVVGAFEILEFLKKEQKMGHC